jgi:hypothetical protein
MWDGEESKRKSLTLSCVSLQSLKLGDAAGSVADSPMTNKRSSWGIGSSNSDKAVKINTSSSTFLGTNFTRGRSGTTNSMNSADNDMSRSRGSWGKRESDTASALLQKRGAWSSPLSILSPRTADATLGFRSELRCESSSDESCNSLSDGDTDEAGGSMLGDMDSFSSDSTEAKSPGKKQRDPKQQRPSSSRSQNDSVVNGKTLPRKLSLQKLLQKVDSGESGPHSAPLLLTSPAQSGSGDDPDQREMGKRIKKCLAVSSCSLFFMLFLLCFSLAERHPQVGPEYSAGHPRHRNCEFFYFAF